MRFCTIAHRDGKINNMSQWTGAKCFMCNGTGEHFASASEPIPGTPFHDGRRNVPTGLRCPACNGHGRDAE